MHACLTSFEINKLPKRCNLESGSGVFCWPLVPNFKADASAPCSNCHTDAKEQQRFSLLFCIVRLNGLLFMNSFSVFFI